MGGVTEAGIAGAQVIELVSDSRSTPYRPGFLHLGFILRILVKARSARKGAQRQVVHGCRQLVS